MYIYILCSRNYNIIWIGNDLKPRKKSKKEGSDETYIPQTSDLETDDEHDETNNKNDENDKKKNTKNNKRSKKNNKASTLEYTTLKWREYNKTRNLKNFTMTQIHNITTSCQVCGVLIIYIQHLFTNIVYSIVLVIR